VRELGITEALVGNPGQARMARELGFALRGDFGLPVFNSQAEREYKRLGFLSLTASFEQKLAQIRDLSKEVDTELIAYGRLPLMITEQCAVHNRTGKHACSNMNQLTDRKGYQFPVVKAYGCRNEILNAHKLFLADREADYLRLGLWAIRLQFTTENGLECVQVLERYQGKGPYTPNTYTRGLYYRGVE
jgi:putative protease